MIGPRRDSVDRIERLGRGGALEPATEAALRRLIGHSVGLEGLSALFEPHFPGVRTFAIQERAAPDQAVEITLVGVARDGSPVWTGSRAFVRGRDGSLEIHRGYDQVVESFRHRNITTDLIQRELDLLELLGGGPRSRLTIDAEGIGRYVCALHGFTFSDLTEEGPPVRSVRAFDADGDRERLREAAVQLASDTAKRLGAPHGLQCTLRSIQLAETPWDFARLTLAGMTAQYAEGDDGEMGVGAFGRLLLLSERTPPWRAALSLHGRERAEWKLGAEYRRRKTLRSQARLQKEVAATMSALRHRQRAVRLRALRSLGAIASSEVIPQLRSLTQDSDRRVASVARTAIRDISGGQIGERMLRFATDRSQDAARRGLVLRVLAQHFPHQLTSLVPMLRIDPDARIQRAVVPCVALGSNAGPELASMLAANPHFESATRPGVEELRIEIIERLTVLRDPSTLPVLMGAYRRQPPPRPAEQLALSRALVVFPDPRAQVVLAEPRNPEKPPPIP
jgi:hypothetical protein